MTLICGDTHGNFKELFTNLKGATDCNLIHVGDLGVGFPFFDEEWLLAVNEEFAEKNIKFYAIRGNHDDPAYFEGQHKYSNLYLVPDGTLLEIDNENYFFIGGGISVDRVTRTRGLSYWEGEIVKPVEVPKQQIDVVISHICPRIALPVPKKAPIIEYYSERDSKLKEDIQKDFDTMDDMCKKLSGVSEWYFGHYHTSMSMGIYRCLNINEIYERKIKVRN